MATKDGSSNVRLENSARLVLPAYGGEQLGDVQPSGSRHPDHDRAV